MGRSLGNRCSSLQQRPRRPGLSPWGQNGEEGTGARLCMASRSLSLSLPAAADFACLSASMRNLSCLTEKKTKSQCGGTEATGGSVTGYRSQSERLREDEISTLCNLRSILLTLSICKQDFLGLGHFLLLFKFLVMHLLSLVKAFLFLEKYHLPERERKRQGGEGARETETEKETNTRKQITQQEGASRYGLLYA